MKISPSLELIMGLAAHEAITAKFSHIEPEHLLMATMKFSELPESAIEDFPGSEEAKALLVAEAKSLTVILERRSFDSTNLRRSLRRAMGQGQGLPEDGKLHRSSAAKAFFVAAARLAAVGGSESLGAEHLLEALLADPSPVILQVLDKKPENVKSEEVVAEVKLSLPELTESLRLLRADLLEKVYGQNHAIHAFIEGLFNAEVVAAADTERKAPRAVFVFAGPPGVGKTFLSELGAAGLKKPFKRFDMSAFAGGHQNDSLVGMPKSYKGAHPGTLTEFVEKNPSAVLLFDEIEKAHQTTIQLFLQILDAGCLEDKYNETNVVFRDTVIVFTTNVGRKLYEDSDGSNLSPGSATFHRATILDALRSEIDPRTQEPFFPGAICSRMATGYPILFNHLKVNELARVAQSELDQISRLFVDEYGIPLEYAPLLPLCLVLREGARVDARTLRAQTGLFVKAELFKLCRLFTADRLHEVLEGVKSIRFQFDENAADEDEEVASLLSVTGIPKVLFVGEQNQARLYQDTIPELSWYAASTSEEALALLAQEDVDFILFDIYLGPPDLTALQTIKQFDYTPSTARGLTLGKEMLRKIYERMPEIPIYLYSFSPDEDETGGSGRSIDEELLLSCMQRGGVRDVVDCHFAGCDGQNWEENRGTFAAELVAIGIECKRERTVGRLRQEHKALTFSSAPLIDSGNHEVQIRFRNLRLSQAVNAEDAGAVLGDVERPRVSFSDVIGADSAKTELKFFIDYLKDPKRFAALGLKTPKGVLLHGPPGTGKTMLARAMAGESDVSFISTAASSFVTKWQGSGPESIREMFARARRYAPAILFIDEIDSIGRIRTGGSTGHGEEMALNALLTELDGFSGQPSTRPVFVLAATNFQVPEAGSSSRESAQLLDPALVRRFSRSILVDLPDRKARKQYFAMHLGRGTAEVSETTLDLLAEKSTGMSIANLEQVIEAALREALRRNCPVNEELLVEALDTAREGEAKEWSPEFLASTAKHEAGHTVMYWLSGWLSPEVSIVARANHGGGMRRCEREIKQESLTRDDLLARIRTVLGGRAAEILAYGESGLTTGASGDLALATDIAKQMICRYGMSTEFGLVAAPELLRHAEAVGTPFYQEVTREAAGILAGEMEKTQAALQEHADQLEGVTRALLEKNRLQQDDLQEILPLDVKAVTIRV